MSDARRDLVSEYREMLREAEEARRSRVGGQEIEQESGQQLNQVSSQSINHGVNQVSSLDVNKNIMIPDNAFTRYVQQSSSYNLHLHSSGALVLGVNAKLSKKPTKITVNRPFVAGFETSNRLTRSGIDFGNGDTSDGKSQSSLQSSRKKKQLEEPAAKKARFAVLCSDDAQETEERKLDRLVLEKHLEKQQQLLASGVVRSSARPESERMVLALRMVRVVFTTELAEWMGSFPGEIIPNCVRQFQDNFPKTEEEDCKVTGEQWVQLKKMIFEMPLQLSGYFASDLLGVQDNHQKLALVFMKFLIKAWPMVFNELAGMDRVLLDHTRNQIKNITNIGASSSSKFNHS